ncbi:MAG: hypothetical protein CMF22_08780 [Idiomarinaceae bacterium]|nr:hypothetical protein [Idiomarinaceae bacterium]MBG23535.1 hypothetical protein [Idiomarinaceae bacterium]|tara:strand:+ start:445 stop:1059 length:615 start_codon:yes stop_codon:yes gene_type:complete
MQIYNLKTAHAPRVRGLTVVELMVGVVVLGIVLSVAVPNFTQFIQTNNLIAEANSTLSGLNLARSEAIKQNTSTIFCHSSDGETCNSAPAAGWEGYIVRAINDVEPILSQRFNNTMTVASDGAITNSQFNGEGDAIRFSGFGLARVANGNNAMNGDLTICANGLDAEENARIVRINSGGRMQIITVAGQMDCDAIGAGGELDGN